MVSNEKLIGQKAKNLLILAENFPLLVPRFEVFTFGELFSNWDELNLKLTKLSVNFLRSKINGDVYEIKSRELLSYFKINKKSIEYIEKRLQDLGFHKVSYRTSALQEDLASNSFAGQYVSFLDENIDIKTIEKCARKCAESLFSIRVLKYMKSKDYSNLKQGGSVIIQEMFYGELSGVLFTENGFNQIEIAYTHSWQNKTVEGELTNNFTIDKSARNIKDELPDEFSNSFLDVIEAAFALERHEGAALDMEWSITDKKAALLQFRPITVSYLDYEIEWDNTNIAESYPGITLPLTYTFIRRLYSKVYPQFLKLLGKKESELSGNSEVFNNMLGYINGRVYYNINNWYKLVSLLPGYKYNKDFFESMLMPAKKKQTHKFLKKKTSFNAKLNFGITALRFFWLLLQTNRLSNRFTKKYLESYRKYESVRWNQMNALEIVSTYSKIEKDLLQQWAIPILNDFRTMVFHGILKKLFFPKNNDDLYIQILSGIYDHTSVEPIRKLGILAMEVKKILQSNNGNQAITTKQILYEKKYREIRKEIEKYLSKYGGRSPDELKLENPRLGESLSDFIDFIVSSADGYSNTSNLNRKKVSGTIENKVYLGMSPIKKLLIKPFFKFILFQAKSGISKRERFRFYRAQVFGLARNVYLALGSRFVDAKLIEEIDDIFYLTINEIQDVILGHSFDHAYKAKINERKKLFLGFSKQNKSRRIISSGLIAPLNTNNDESINKLAKNKFNGLGVSKGIYKGKVIVVKEFDPKVDVSGKILVTSHTDPGWTLLFLNAAALIVERGNALSHASIVSREIGIPAVVAVENACDIFKNNDTVIVNGSSGAITVV